jgi:hypothetical protein
MTLDEFRDIEKKATQGPWYDASKVSQVCGLDVCEPMVLFDEEKHDDFVLCRPHTNEDAAFIAASREMVPKFINLFDAADKLIANGPELIWSQEMAGLFNAMAAFRT